MKTAYTKKNFLLASHFAGRILANSSTGKMAEQAKKIKAHSERNATDAIEIEYDQFAEFDICAYSHTPIYAGSPMSQCPFDGSKYQATCKGKVCKVCEVCQIGAPASGLRLLANVG